MVAVLLEDEKKNMQGLKGKRRKLSELERMCERKSSSKKEALLTACSILVSDHMYSNFILIFLMFILLLTCLTSVTSARFKESFQLLGFFLQIFKSVWQLRLWYMTANKCLVMQ